MQLQSSTEYQLVRGVLYIRRNRDDYNGLAQFGSLRHLTIVHDDLSFTVPIYIWRSLDIALNKLSQLQTITLDVINRASIEIIESLPLKITSINIACCKDMSLLEKHFPLLIHCNPPWEPGIEKFCCKMPNLRSLVFDGVPESFHCFTIMDQLESLTWYLDEIQVEEWNMFTAAMSPTLRKLCVDSTVFESILGSQHAFALPFLTTFYISSLEEEDLRFNVKKIMPQLKHYHVYLFGQKTKADVERLAGSMPKFVTQYELNTFSMYFLDALCKFMRITYYKGDNKACMSLYDKEMFGIS